MNEQVDIAHLYKVKSNKSNKNETNPHANPKEQSFTLMLIIIHVKLVDSDPNIQGTHKIT
jgi:hypothetical protein